jgi:hypothetical protein
MVRFDSASLGSHGKPGMADNIVCLLFSVHLQPFSNHKIGPKMKIASKYRKIDFIFWGVSQNRPSVPPGVPAENPEKRQLSSTFRPAWTGGAGNTADHLDRGKPPENFTETLTTPKTPENANPFITIYIYLFVSSSSSSIGVVLSIPAVLPPYVKMTCFCPILCNTHAGIKEGVYLAYCDTEKRGLLPFICWCVLPPTGTAGTARSKPLPRNNLTPSRLLSRLSRPSKRVSWGGFFRDSIFHKGLRQNDLTSPYPLSKRVSR